MTSNQFNKLSLKEKGVIYTEEGTHIENRINYGINTVLIYAVFNFYVEVTLDVKANKIIDIKALETTEDYYGFMKSLKLSDLY